MYLKIKVIDKQRPRYIIIHYKRLMNKYLKIKIIVKHSTSMKIHKLIRLKSFKKYIETVKEKLNVTEKDLCENCKKLSQNNNHSVIFSF